MAVVGAQDHSFTYIATAGMFEDTYDFFKSSPAYMPGFEKNAFWGQLSNLRDHSDYIFDNSANDAYLLGGEMAIGPGRLGLMLDWYSNVNPEYNEFYGGSGHGGFGEGTYEQYLDRDSDTIIDARQETYGRSDYTSKHSEMDVYAAYALGGFAGFDLGAAVRGIWDANNPSYYTSSPLWSYKESFDLNSYNRQYDLNTGQLLFDWSEQGGGSYTYGSGIWALILGARSKTLLPGLDLVANLTPALYSWDNKVEWNYTSNTNYNPASVDDDIVSRSITGINGNNFNAVHPLTGSSLGVNANVRGDYALTPRILLTAILSGGTSGWNPKDEKMEETYTERRRTTTLIGGIPTVQTGTTNDSSITSLEEKGGTNYATLNLRAQFPANGWRLGLGLNAYVIGNNNEVVATENTHDTYRWDANDGDPANSYTMVTTSSERVKNTYETLINQLELPVGIILDVLSNLQVQLGAKHTIAASSSSSKYDLLSQTLMTTVRTFDNGVSTSTINPPSGMNEEQTHEYSVEQYTQMFYGVSWQPYEQMQIDFAGFGGSAGLLTLANWRLSVNIYY